MCSFYEALLFTLDFSMHYDDQFVELIKCMKMANFTSAQICKIQIINQV